MLWKIAQFAPLFGQDGGKQRLQLVFFLLISISIHKFSTEDKSMLIVGFKL